MKPVGSRQNGQSNATKHGLTILKRAVNGIGNRLIDRRTVTGRALARWRADLIRDIGGDPSTQELALIDLCVKTKLILDSADVWLLSQGSLIDKRKRSLLPAARERQQLADALARYLTILGVKRVSKEISLSDYLSEKYGEQDTHNSRSRVHVNKTASDNPVSQLVKEKDLDA
jgi:hypothetical protein